MITKMNYLLLSTIMIAAIDSTFGKCCDCCKKLCADKDNNESFINDVDNKTHKNAGVIPKYVNAIYKDINDNIHNENNFRGDIGNNNNFYNTNKNNDFFPENLESNDNSNHKKIMHDEKFNSKKVNENENEKTLYFKIDKDANDENNIKKCFNNKWYEACKNKVLLLQEVNENDTGVLSVTGSDNDWKITDQGKVLESAGCNPNNNKWIIVKVTILNDNSDCAVGSFIFYVDEIKRVVDGNDDFFGVFEEIECYSIEIIAANTSAVQDMSAMFYGVYSVLEQNKGKNTGPGLIGLEKLNVENVTIISNMFSASIYKQATLEQLKKWRFGVGKSVLITELFYSTVKGLNFRVLDDWDTHTTNGDVVFTLGSYSTMADVFVQGNNKNDFAPPRWYNTIGELILS